MRDTRIVIFGWADSAHIHRWARALTLRNFKVRVISSVPGDVQGVETVVIRCKSKVSYLAKAPQAARAANAFHPDIVHVHYAGGLGLWGLWTRHPKLVVSTWGSDITSLTSSARYRALIRRVLRKASAVTATSRFLMDKTIALEPTVKSRSHVVPFGVAIPEIPPPLPGSELIRICAIKNHKHIYGLDLLLRAIPQIVQRVARVHIDVAGTGAITEELKHLARDLAIEDAVSFVGHIPYDQVYDFITRHHIVVMPSRVESFGVAALEASACARPVIASNVGGVPEVVLDGDTGILVPSENPDALANAIITLAKNPDRIAAMGQAGYNFVRDAYTWDSSIETMVRIYRQVLDE